MKHLAAVALLAAAITGALPRAAQAQGGSLNLSWDDCGVAGQLNKDFACAADTGVSVLIASVVLGSGGPSGITPTDIRSSIFFVFSGQMPSWWALQPGGCRPGALSVHEDAPDVTGCEDYWQTHQGAVAGYSWSILDRGLGPEAYHLQLQVYVDTQFAETLFGSHHILAGRIVIQHQRTTGTDSCAGCSLRGAITFDLASVGSLEYGSTSITNPNHRNYVYWQDGLVPTRRTTWGSVKSLYR